MHLQQCWDVLWYREGAEESRAGLCGVQSPSPCVGANDERLQSALEESY